MISQQSVQTQARIEGEILKWGKCLCGSCGQKGKMGTTTRPTPQRPVVKILCIDCAHKDIATRLNIPIGDARDKLKRQQKTQEIIAKVIMDRYKDETGRKLPKSFEELSQVVQPGMDWWYNGLSETDRDRVERLSKDEQKDYFRTAPLLPQPRTPIVVGEQAGRNDPCPCGSGKKFKKCCLDKAA